MPVEGTFRWPVDVNDPNTGWIKDPKEEEEDEVIGGEREEGEQVRGDQQDQDLGGHGGSDPVGPHPDQLAEDPPILQEECPELQIEENCVVPLKSMAAAFTVLDTGPITAVEGNAGKGSPTQSPEL